MKKKSAPVDETKRRLFSAISEVSGIDISKLEGDPLSLEDQARFDEVCNDPALNLRMIRLFYQGIPEGERMAELIGGYESPATRTLVFGTANNIIFYESRLRAKHNKDERIAEEILGRNNYGPEYALKFLQALDQPEVKQAFSRSSGDTQRWINDLIVTTAYGTYDAEMTKKAAAAAINYEGKALDDVIATISANMVHCGNDFILDDSRAKSLILTFADPEVAGYINRQQEAVLGKVVCELGNMAYFCADADAVRDAVRSIQTFREEFQHDVANMLYAIGGLYDESVENPSLASIGIRTWIQVAERYDESILSHIAKRSLRYSKKCEENQGIIVDQLEALACEDITKCLDRYDTSAKSVLIDGLFDAIYRWGEPGNEDVRYGLEEMFSDIGYVRDIMSFFDKIHIINRVNGLSKRTQKKHISPIMAHAEEYAQEKRALDIQYKENLLVR